MTITNKSLATLVGLVATTMLLALPLLASATASPGPPTIPEQCYYTDSGSNLGN